MTWTDTEAALWELKAMGVGPEQIWRDPDGHARGDVYGATADEMRRIADLLGCLDAGRVPLPKGPAGPAKFESFNSYEDEKRVWAWLLDGAQGLKLTSLDRLVLVSLARHANSKTREAWPGDETLSALADVHVGSVDRSLGRLRKAGLIESRPGGRNHRARHTLVGPIAQPVGEAIGMDSSTERAHSSTPQLDSSTHGLTGSRRNKEKQGEAAARDESHSEKTDLCAVCGIPADTVRTTPIGIEYTEVEYLAWCQDKTAQRSGHFGLTKKIHNEDRAEYEAQLRKGEGEARTKRAQQQRDEDRRNCPFNHSEAAPGLGYRLVDGTPTTYDHPDAESFRCEHGKPDTATRAQTRESGNLTGVGEIAEELIHR